MMRSKIPLGEVVLANQQREKNKIQEITYPEPISFLSEVYVEHHDELKRALRI
jgi:hypothetical protein